jgi:hypothetical protein
MLEKYANYKKKFEMLNYKQDINELNFDKKLINFIYNLFQKFILIIS